MMYEALLDDGKVANACQGNLSGHTFWLAYQPTWKAIYILVHACTWLLWLNHKDTINARQNKAGTCSTSMHWLQKCRWLQTFSKKIKLPLSDDGDFRRVVRLNANSVYISRLVSFDRILIYNRTSREHFTRLKDVFSRLKQAGMKLKPKKCLLLWKKISYYMKYPVIEFKHPTKVDWILSFSSTVTMH